MKSQSFKKRNGRVSAGKFSGAMLRVSSEVIRVYLWFLQISNYLLRLVQ